MAVKPTDIRATIEEKSKKFAEILYHNYRPDLDKRVTILDLSYESLKVNIYIGDKLHDRTLETYGYIHATLREVLREKLPANRQFTSLEDPEVIKYLARPNWSLFLIDGGPDKFFLVAPENSRNFRQWLTENISRDPRLLKTRFGETKIYNKVMNRADKWTGSYDVTTRSKFDIGHIPSADSENLTSPLEEKITTIIDFAIASGNTRIATVAQKSLQNLYTVQAEFGYSFKNVSQEDITAAKRVLGKGYVVTTIHTANRNNQFAGEEKAIFSALAAEIALKLPSAKGSNSIIEDLASNIADTIEFGKIVRKQTHTEHKGKQTINLSKKVSVSGNTAQIKVNQTKNIAEQPISLASLQALINNALGERIADNMGQGDREDILNFRSGRFASTVEVERMSTSREGMITAFYRYMKYPYATFEPGGRQGLPKSRDPKLLISKSIREIAAKIVGNRMRAVSL